MSTSSLQARVRRLEEMASASDDGGTLGFVLRGPPAMSREQLAGVRERIQQAAAQERCVYVANLTGRPAP